MKTLIVEIAAMALITACGVGSEGEFVVTQTTAPQPSPTSTVDIAPTTTPSTPTATVVVAPTPTATFAARAPATSTATPEPENSPDSTPLPDLTGEYSSDVFDFSFNFPSNWTLDESDDQVITVAHPQNEIAVVVGIDIMSTAQSIKDYTTVAVELFGQEFSTFETTSSSGTIVGELPGTVTFGEITSADGKSTQVKLYTAVIARMGFTVSMASQDASFAVIEPIFDAIVDTTRFPSGSFEPPPMVVSRELMASGINTSASEPIGVATVFEESAPALFSFLHVDYLPIGTELQFIWFQTDRDGAPIDTVDPITAEAGDDGAFWSTFEPQEAISLGFYFVAVFTEDGLIAAIPFAVVIEEGAEFNDAQSYVDWGVFLLAIEETPKAIYATTKALELDDTNAEAYVIRAEAHSTSCEVNNATADLTKALVLQPDNAVIMAKRGTSHWFAQDAAKAILDYNKAINLEPNNAGFYNNRSLIQVAIGRLDAALADANRALELQPSSLGALDSRGYAYLKANHFRNAKQDYDTAINGGFEVSYTLLGGGLANAGLGDNDLAREMLELGLDMVADEATQCQGPQITDLVRMAKQALVNL